MINLSIDNFRGFNNASIDLSKINILIGENSGGKTSLIKLLLLLKQSMETPNKDKKINVNGHLIDLGNFDSFINRKSNEKYFTVSFIVDSDEYINYYLDFIAGEDANLEEFVEKHQYFLADPVKIDFTFRKDDNEFFTDNILISSENIGSIHFNITEEDKHFSILTEVFADIKINHKKHGEVTLTDKLSVFGFMLLVSPGELISYAKEHKLDTFVNELAFLLIIQNYLASLLKDIHYINPIKFNPARIMLKRDNSFNGKINDFESLVNALSSLKESYEPMSKRILRNFNAAIKELEIADEIKLETNSSIPVTELKVKKAGTWSSIVDVGYGVGLQVPILLQAIICSESQKQHTLIIEQPEIHLHPALHSRFIDILIKYAGDTRLIIETHSEHIIRKLQVLTKKDTIASEDIKIYYFRNKSGVFEITNHNILDNGKLEPIFSKGFYDNSYTLSKELY